jgi:aralkylamine N-acetyltransferase
MAVEAIELRRTVEGLTFEQMEGLFSAAGLGGRVGHKILRAFRNSPHVRVAFDADRLVGASRAITDGEYHAVIYDVAVDPDYQATGIGRRMMEELLRELRVWRVMLVAAEDVRGFYAGFGFAPYPDVLAKLDPERLHDPIRGPG